MSVAVLDQFQEEFKAIFYEMFFVMHSRKIHIHRNYIEGGMSADKISTTLDGGMFAQPIIFNFYYQNVKEAAIENNIIISSVHTTDLATFDSATSTQQAIYAVVSRSDLSDATILNSS